MSARVFLCLPHVLHHASNMKARAPRDAQRNSNLATALMRKGNGPAAYPEDFLLPYEEAMKYFNIALELDALSAAAIEGMNVRSHTCRFKRRILWML